MLQGKGSASDLPADQDGRGWEPYTDEGFIGLVGPFWQRFDGDVPHFAFTADHKHHNRLGVVQGGMLMTFADRAMGMTAWHAIGRRHLATVQLDVHFIETAKIGEFVEAHCTVLRQTRSMLFMDGALRVGSNSIAAARGVWKIVGRSGS